MRGITALRLFGLSVALGAAAPGLTGCGLRSVKLVTDQPRYLPDDRVTLRLENGTLGRVGYNLCGSTLERHEDGAWRPVPSRDAGACLAILYVARALRTGRPWVSRLPAHLPAGRYRFTTRVELPFGKRWRSLSSAPFTVTQGGAGAPARIGLRPRTIAIPTRLRVERRPRGLWVSADPAEPRQVPIQVSPGLTVGVRFELYLVEGGVRRLVSSGLGGRADFGSTLVSLAPSASSASSAAPSSAPRTALQLLLTVFETDVPVQHLWSPASGRRYRELWRGFVRGTPPAP